MPFASESAIEATPPTPGLPANKPIFRYWGKRDTKLNLPTNPSLSVTLAQEDLQTRTTATTSSTYTKDQLFLNGELSDLEGDRTQACLRELRSKRAKLEAADSSLPTLSEMPLRIASENNFPTAAGLASSAAGFAALIRAIADLYELTDSPAELSKIARQGSGSACRSMFGGYVAWRMGEKADGSDSLADLVADVDHWDMAALILVVSAAKKDVSSTSGMQLTVHTSDLFQHRIAKVAQANMEKLEASVREKDFAKFAEYTMRDSNSFHATCADTYPPIFYMNDTSRAAIRAVDTINKQAGRTIAAYTYDAGPNCVIYFLREDTETVVAPFYAALSNVAGWKEGASAAKGDIKLEDHITSILADGVTSVIQTGIGGGPSKSDNHLISEEGNPL